MTSEKNARILLATQLWLVTSAALLPAPPALAQVYNWTGAASGFTNNRNNWSPAALPTSSSSVVFGELGQTFTVSPMLSTINFHDVTFSGNTGYTISESIGVASGNLTTLGSATHRVTSVATGPIANWSIDAPLVLSALPGVASANTNLTKTGAGTLTFSAGVGTSRLSSLTLLGGSTRLNSGGTLGVASSTATSFIDVRGANLELVNFGLFATARSSSGAAGLKGDITLRASSTSSANVRLSNGLLSTFSSIVVGAPADDVSTYPNTLTLSDRAMVVSPESLIVGANRTSSVDTLILTTNSGLGSSSSVARPVGVGIVPGSNGAIILRDAPTYLAASTLTLGNQTAASPAGVGTVTVEAGNTLEVANALTFNSSTSSLTSAGSVTVGGFASASGITPNVRIANSASGAGLKIQPGFYSASRATYRFSGIISDAGPLPADVELNARGGGGPLSVTQIFAARQAYTGITRVGSATLQLDIDDAITASSGLEFTTFADLNLGGFRQHIGPITGSVGTISGSAGSLLFTPSIQSATGTFNVPLVVAGPIVHPGSGTTAIAFNGSVTAASMTLEGGSFIFNAPITTPILNAATASTISFSGSSSLTGNANIAGNLRLSPSTLVDGDLTLFRTSTLLINASGNTPLLDLDHLSVKRELHIDGALSVVLASNLFPVSGQSFDILDFNPATTTGVFAALALPALPPTFYWDISNLYTTGTLTVLPEPTALVALVLILPAFSHRRRR